MGDEEDAAEAPLQENGSGLPSHLHGGIPSRQLSGIRDGLNAIIPTFAHSRSGT
jgi:hypothetical protein